MADSTTKLTSVAASGNADAASDLRSHHQRALPLPWRSPGFANPAELDFARIMTFYRIRWVYEPTTFALTYTPEGRPREMFTPDFYLPDHQLYIELTTMRQQLVTRKNRKFRLLRELYPNVQIKLLYRRDYHRLVDAYRSGDRNTCQALELTPLHGEEAVGQRITELASEVASTVPADTPLLLLTCGDGALRFSRELAGQLVSRGVQTEDDQIRLSRFRTEQGLRRVRVARQPSVPINGRRVLLVTDIVSTGMSLAYLITWLRDRGARSVEVCTLLDRRDARLIDVPIAHVGFTAPNDLIVGYGMKLRRQDADIPHLATINADARC